MILPPNYELPEKRSKTNLQVYEATERVLTHGEKSKFEDIEISNLKKSSEGNEQLQLDVKNKVFSKEKPEDGNKNIKKDESEFSDQTKPPLGSGQIEQSKVSILKSVETTKNEAKDVQSPKSQTIYPESDPSSEVDEKKDFSGTLF
jgi:hypothetical protein